MDRLSLLYPQNPSKNNLDPQPVTYESLHNQPGNFFVIGVDARNPWNGQSHKLGPSHVLGLTRSGIDIRATPHIGLHWPSNSMYPHMGVRICDYKGNQSEVDTADEPQNVKERGAIHNCALQTEPVLSPYLRLNPEAIRSNGYISAKNFAEKINLGHVHHEAKRLALGPENLMLDSDLLLFPWVHDFFQVLIENEVWILQDYDRFGIFDRHVSTEGKIERSQPGTVSDIEAFLHMKNQHAIMIREDCILPATGFFPIKEALILLDSVVSYWQQKQLTLEYEGIGDTFTVSGIDMINYTKSPALRAVLDRMYKALLNSGKFEWLPKFMGHSILPGGTFRFLPCNAEESLCEVVNQLLDLNDERTELNRVLGQELETNVRSHWLLHSKEIINPAFKVARKDFVTLLDQRRGFSQYDLLNGEHVPQDIVDRLMIMSFEQIQNLFKAE